MTKSNITREESIQAVFDLKVGYTLDLADIEILKRVARMALAVMDGEPHTDDELSNLLWYSQEATCHSDPNYYCEFQRLATPGLIAGIIRELQERRKADSEPVAYMYDGEDGTEYNGHGEFSGGGKGIPLYRHARPALVIPDEMTSGQAYEIGYYYGDPVDVFARGANWMRQHIIDSTLAADPQSPGSEPATVPGKWISVSERMPEMGEKQRYVLAADFKNNYCPNIPNTQVGVYGDWFDDGNPTWDDGDGEDLHLKEVTHWMPLPAGPQEVR